MKYALINAAGTKVDEIREWETTPPDVGASGTPNRYWLPYELINPPFDSRLQVRTGPTRAILADKATDTYIVRDKTPTELAADLEARKDQGAGYLDDVDRLERALVSVIMDEFNRYSTAVQGIKDAAAAAASLAAFKTNMAALQVPPTRTLADLRAAIRNKIGQ